MFPDAYGPTMVIVVTMFSLYCTSKEFGAALLRRGSDCGHGETVDIGKCTASQDGWRTRKAGETLTVRK